MAGLGRRAVEKAPMGSEVEVVRNCPWVLAGRVVGGTREVTADAAGTKVAAVRKRPWLAREAVVVVAVTVVSEAVVAM